MRMTKEQYYMNIAKAVSMRSTCNRRHYGAVIVKDDVIVATGYNGSPRGSCNCCDTGYCCRNDAVHNDGNYGQCPAVHAEMNAILSCSRQDMYGGKIFLYGEDEHGNKVLNATPCQICERMIKNAALSVYSGKLEENIIEEP